jgi:hypothetical protein
MRRTGSIANGQDRLRLRDRRGSRSALIVALPLFVRRSTILCILITDSNELPSRFAAPRSERPPSFALARFALAARLRPPPPPRARNMISSSILTPSPGFPPAPPCPSASFTPSPRPPKKRKNSTARILSLSLRAVVNKFSPNT